MCSAPRCGKAGIVEHDGSVYSCDHFIRALPFVAEKFAIAIFTTMRDNGA